MTGGTCPFDGCVFLGGAGQVEPVLLIAVCFYGVQDRWNLSF